jgi:hypothetical protein
MGEEGSAPATKIDRRMPNFARLPINAENVYIRVAIETPRGSHAAGIISLFVTKRVPSP